MEASAPDIIRLFPTFVWWRRLEQECYEPLDRDLMAYVDTLISSGGGTVPAPHGNLVTSNTIGQSLLF